MLDYSGFREPMVQEESIDKNLIQMIYDTCQIAHNWRCITVDNNRLYRCPQSMILGEENNCYVDSICLDQISDYNSLLLFLENSNCLQSCARCLGSVGKKIEHKQIVKSTWFDYLPATLDCGVDREYAKVLARTLDYKSDCMKRNRLN